MCLLVQIKEKHILCCVDGDGVEFHVATTVAGYSYPFHGLSFIFIAVAATEAELPTFRNFATERF
jgi:hypothetical protein